MHHLGGDNAILPLCTSSILLLDQCLNLHKKSDVQTGSENGIDQDLAVGLALASFTDSQGLMMLLELIDQKAMSIDDILEV